MTCPNVTVSARPPVMPNSAQPPHAHWPQNWPLWYVLPAMGALPTAPRTARAHVCDVLGEWGLLHHFEDNATLAASELVTNAVRQATGEDGKPIYVGGKLPVVQLSLFSNRSRLLVVVFDQLPGTPVEQHVGSDAESGRGLAIVASLGAWDWRTVQGGKVVRALLSAAA